MRNKKDGFMEKKRTSNSCLTNSIVDIASNGNAHDPNFASTIFGEDESNTNLSNQFICGHCWNHVKEQYGVDSPIPKIIGPNRTIVADYKVWGKQIKFRKMQRVIFFVLIAFVAAAHFSLAACKNPTGPRKQTRFEGLWRAPTESPLRHIKFSGLSATFIMDGENWLKGAFAFTESAVEITFTHFGENDQWAELAGPTIIRFNYDSFILNDSFNVTRFTEENQWSPGQQTVQVEYHGEWKHESTTTP